MSRMLYSMAVLGALAAAIAFAQPAQAIIEYPWCAQYGIRGDGGRNCGFTTLAQCQATVSGIGGFCERNTFYRGPVKRSRSSSRQED